MNSLGSTPASNMSQPIARIHAGQLREGWRYYYWISRGVDNREVRAYRIRKSVGAENTSPPYLTIFEQMLLELQPLIDKVWRNCEEKGSRGRTVTLHVNFAQLYFSLLAVISPVLSAVAASWNRYWRITESPLPDEEGVQVFSACRFPASPPQIPALRNRLASPFRSVCAVIHKTQPHAKKISP